MVQFKKYEQADDFFKKALTITYKNYGKKHQLVGKIFFEMGHMELSQNKINRAHEFFNDALSMQQLVLPAKHPELIETQSVLSNL